MQRLRPMNDYIFKKLFGESENLDNLKSFLNAVLYNDEVITEIELINEKELTTDNINDKKGIIDVLAKINDGTQVNIEVQLTDQDNMDKRTLFYWSRIYNRGIVKGEDYSNLNKVITINLLNFKYIELENFHTSFSLRENENSEYLLTDVLEIHFIEMPKFKALKDKNLENDKLNRWMMFLRNDISDKELEVLVSMDNDIKKAEEKLEYLSADPVVQELYFERERALHEKANLISTGLRKGREEGRLEGRIEGREEGRIEEQIKIIKNMIDNGFDNNVISNITGLSLDEIERLMNYLQ